MQLGPENLVLNYGLIKGWVKMWSLYKVATLPINPMIPGGAEANYADCVGNDKDLGWEGKE